MEERRRMKKLSKKGLDKGEWIREEAIKNNKKEERGTDDKWRIA